MASEVLLPPWFDCAPAWSDNQEAGGEVVKEAATTPQTSSPTRLLGGPNPSGSPSERCAAGRRGTSIPSRGSGDPYNVNWFPAVVPRRPGRRSESNRRIAGRRHVPGTAGTSPRVFGRPVADRVRTARPLFHDVGKCRQGILDHVEFICGDNPNLHLPGWGVNRHSSQQIMQSIARYAYPRAPAGGPGTDPTPIGPNQSRGGAGCLSTVMAVTERRDRAGPPTAEDRVPGGRDVTGRCPCGPHSDEVRVPPTSRARRLA